MLVLDSTERDGLICHPFLAIQRKPDCQRGRYPCLLILCFRDINMQKIKISVRNATQSISRPREKSARTLLTVIKHWTKWNCRDRHPVMAVEVTVKALVLHILSNH